MMACGSLASEAPAEEGVAVIVELTPRGWLDTRQATRLRRDVLIALNRGCEAIIISGIDLRYRDVSGLAGLGALLAETRAHSPQVPVWLCHISPDLRAAAALAALDDSWLLVPDRATALDSIMRGEHWPTLPAAPSSSLEAVHV